MSLRDPESPSSRSKLLDAAEELMREEGYAAVTSRRVAAQAGLKPQLVHYYFRAMDDLFLALFRRLGTELTERLDMAALSDRPLRDMWENLTDARSRSLLDEFVALSNHRKVVSAEILLFGNQFRQKQKTILAGLLKRNGLDGFPWTPAFAAVLLNSLARSVAVERGIGMENDHAELFEVVDHYIAEYDGAEPTLESKMKQLELENERLKKLLAENMVEGRASDATD